MFLSVVLLVTKFQKSKTIVQFLWNFVSFTSPSVMDVNPTWEQAIPIILPELSMNVHVSLLAAKDCPASCTKADRGNFSCNLREKFHQTLRSIFQTKFWISTFHHCRIQAPGSPSLADRRSLSPDARKGMKPKGRRRSKHIDSCNHSSHKRRRLRSFGGRLHLTQLSYELSNSGRCLFHYFCKQL